MFPLGLVGGGIRSRSRKSRGWSWGSDGGAGRATGSDLNGGSRISSASASASSKRTFAPRFASRSSRRRAIDFVTCSLLPARATDIFEAEDDTELALRSASVGPRVILGGGLASSSISVATERGSSAGRVSWAGFFSDALELVVRVLRTPRSRSSKSQSGRSRGSCAFSV